MVLARGRPGDREKALALLASSLEAARELGMHGVLEEIGALQRQD